MQDVEVVVVGAGVMGSATSWALARAGHEVVALEQFEIGHKRGSSHGASRIFRLSYHDPTYVEMAMDALHLWRELEDETAETLITTTGGLDLGKKLDDHVRALESCGAKYELVDGAEINARFPVLSVPERAEVLFQPDAGIAHAERAWRVFVRAAVEHGATLLQGTAVLGLTPGDGRVEVRTPDEVFRAKVAVVTAGAWARDLLDDVAIDLPTTPTRETIAYFKVDGWDGAPSIVEWGDPSRYSLMSPAPEGIKAGEHHAGPATDPNDEGKVNERSVARLSEWVAQRYPTAEPSPTSADTCIYTNTRDEHFVLERHGPIVVGSPCSGHGFKFAPLVGTRLADLATVRG